MYPIEEFERTVLKFAGVMRRLGVPFAMTGGMASVTHGEPRYTQDADAVIDPDVARRKSGPIVKSLEAADYFLNAETVRDAIARGRQFQLLDNADVLKIDVYPHELVNGEVSRAVMREVFAGHELPVIAVPDAVASKLVWISRGSHKSRRDVRLMYDAASEDERAAIVESARLVEMSDLLTEVLAEADEIEPPA